MKDSICRFSYSRNWDSRIAEQGASLNKLKEKDLEAIAHTAINKYNGSILRADFNAAAEARASYYAVLWCLNHGSLLGLFAEDYSPGNYLRRKFAADRGVVPNWGQSGVFEIVVQGTPVLVRREGGIDKYLGDCSFEALDPDGFFVDGVESYLACVPFSQVTVDQAASDSFEYLMSHKGIKIQESHRELVERRLHYWKNFKVAYRTG